LSSSFLSLFFIVLDLNKCNQRLNFNLTEKMKRVKYFSEDQEKALYVYIMQ
jgi:hypothetical protein